MFLENREKCFSIMMENVGGLREFLLSIFAKTAGVVI